MDAIRNEKPVIVDQPARLVTIEKRTGAPDIQMFDAGAVNAAIDRQMAALPKDKTLAAIGYVDKEGASVALVGRVPHIPGEAAWTVTGTRKWSGDWNASAAFRWAI